MARTNYEAGGGLLGLFKPKADVKTAFSPPVFSSGSSNAPVVSASDYTFNGPQIVQVLAQHLPAGRADFSYAAMVGNGLGQIPVDTSGVQGVFARIFASPRWKGAFRRSA